MPPTPDMPLRCHAAITRHATAAIDAARFCRAIRAYYYADDMLRYATMLSMPICYADDDDATPDYFAALLPGRHTPMMPHYMLPLLLL